MNLLTDSLETKIQETIISPAVRQDYVCAVEAMKPTLDDLYGSIPENKRISYGITYTIKVLAEHLHAGLVKENAPILEIASRLYENSRNHLEAGVALGILAEYGISDYTPVLPFFERAAASPEWELREFTQMFFRRLIKRYPDEMQVFLRRLVKSPDANLRRFVSETLRPVQENQWFYKTPGYSLTVLRHLFQESAAYPRTSVGNNLSDLARRLPELVYDLVAELVASGDKNSYWIAYRACRNLVKQEPLRVMDLLSVDEYRYKERVYRRSSL